MRLLIPAVALLFAFALAGSVQAGENCPYSKSKTTTAAAETEPGASCSQACPHAKDAALAGTCGSCSAGKQAEDATAAKTDGSDVSTQGGLAANN
jgi:hypothetical protein